MMGGEFTGWREASLLLKLCHACFSRAAGGQMGEMGTSPCFSESSWPPAFLDVTASDIRNHFSNDESHLSETLGMANLTTRNPAMEGPISEPLND